MDLQDSVEYGHVEFAFFAQGPETAAVQKQLHKVQKQLRALQGHEPPWSRWGALGHGSVFPEPVGYSDNKSFTFQGNCCSYPLPLDKELFLSAQFLLGSSSLGVLQSSSCSHGQTVKSQQSLHLWSICQLCANYFLFHFRKHSFLFKRCKRKAQHTTKHIL